MLNLFKLRYPYTNPIDFQRARAMLLTNGFFLIISLIWGVVILAPRLLQGTQLEENINFLILPVFAAFIYWAIQNGRIQLASGVFVAALIFINIPPYLATYDVAINPAGSLVALVFTPIVAAGVLLGQRGILVTAAVIGVLVFLKFAAQSTLNIPIQTTPSELALIEFGIALSAIIPSFGLLYLFNSITTRAVGDTLVTVEQLEEVASYLTKVSENENEDAILAYTGEMIREKLNYPIVQIFIRESGDQLIRRIFNVSSHTTSDKTIRMRTSATSIVQQVSISREPLLITPADGQPGHILPPARSSYILPIMYRGDLLGILDVQSERKAFNEGEQTSLRLLTEQLAIAIIQARTIEDLEKTLRDQETAAARFQTQLNNLQRVSRETLTSGWDNYLDARSQAVFGFDIQPNEAHPIPTNDLPPHLLPVLATGKVITESWGKEQVLNIPIMLRGEILGAMSFIIPSDKPLTKRQIDLAQIVADRLAMSLESTRLFEQSQSQAARERKASEVATLLIQATDVQSVLNLAAESFNDALGAVYTRVYLQPDNVTDNTVTESDPQ